MKKFNVCRGYDIRIENFTVPHGAVYGNYDGIKYVCISKKPYQLFGKMNMLFAFIQSETGEWEKTRISGKFANFIIRKMQENHATAEELPIEINQEIRERRREIQRRKAAMIHGLEVRDRKIAHEKAWAEFQARKERNAKFEGLHEIILQSQNPPRKKKLRLFSYTKYENRHNKADALDIAEKAICHLPLCSN